MMTSRVFRVLVVGMSVVMGLQMVAWPSLAVTRTATAAAEAQQQRMDNLKTRAEAEIDRRVTSLSTLLGKVNGLKRLSEAQKSAFTSGIQSEISSLSSLKTKIAGDTDVTTLKTDVQSIVTSYRVYLVYMPQVHILAAADAAAMVDTNLTTLMGKLQTRVSQAQTQGHDVSAMQSALADMQTKLTDATAQANAATSAVESLTPDGYPANKTQLETGRSDMKTAETDLKAAWADAKNIVAALKALHTSQATPSASPIVNTQ